MSNREEIRSRMTEDGIEFLLAQFVDMHGAAKVKMVPVSAFDAPIDEGAGFAGAAVWRSGWATMKSVKVPPMSTEAR